MKNKYKIKLIFFVVCILVLLSIGLFISYKSINKKAKEAIKEVNVEEKIDLKNYINKEVSDEAKSINYPYFNYYDLDIKILRLISDYKESNKIEYEINYMDEIVNIYFTINSNNKNINYDIKDLKEISNEELTEKVIKKEELLVKLKNKYPNNIYEIIEKDNFNNATYKINEEGLYIYFNKDLFSNVSYEVFMFVKSDNNKEVFNQTYDKVIAFTFDDGPSEYTLDIANTLIENNSKATFFELGNRMKYNQDIVREVYNKGMEIGSHTYSHKNLVTLSESSLINELNSTTIIYKEITNDDIKLTRPPYGNINSLIKKNVTTPIITWDVDTNDWLYRDAYRTYNHILENAQDGDIILMHDIYKETLDAVKLVVPELIARGYKITTVSDLANEKGVTLEEKKVYRSVH